MRYWQGLILYLAAFILQPFLHNLIPGLGGNVNLILCLTVILTFLYDETVIGIFFGLVFGLAGDLFYGMYAGPGGFAFVAVGVAVLLLKRFANKENSFNALIMMLLSTWMYASVYWLVYYFIGSPYSYLYAMKSLPWQLLFNAVVAAILYFVLIKRVIKHRRDRYFR